MVAVTGGLFRQLTTKEKRRLVGGVFLQDPGSGQNFALTPRKNVIPA